VFCKAPMPGQVKTRLIPFLSAEAAAQLHCELAEKTLQTAAENNLCEMQLWCSPSTDHPFYRALSKKYPITLFVQQGTGLGERMHHAFVKALTRYKSAIIIGCDCPSLTAADLEEALNLLRQGKQCVIAPAEDGGYVLIGLKQPQATLFDNMPWGTAKVLGLTRDKLQSLAFDYHELNPQWDLDNMEDLRRYQP
jgi:uncharacterized protein